MSVYIEGPKSYTKHNKRKEKRKKKPSADRPSSNESNSNQERVLWVGYEDQDMKENVGECAATALDDMTSQASEIKVLDKSRGGRKCSRRKVY